MNRWVRKDRRIYDFSGCAACGTCWGAAPGAAKQGHTCSVTTCLACGTDQCMGNGLGGGECGVCYYGLLLGWSGTDRPCGYKGCRERAVATTPRVGFACKAHLARSGLDVRIQGYLADRDKTWELWPCP